MLLQSLEREADRLRRAGNLSIATWASLVVVKASGDGKARAASVRVRDGSSIHFLVDLSDTKINTGRQAQQALEVVSGGSPQKIKRKKRKEDQGLMQAK